MKRKLLLLLTCVLMFGAYEDRQDYHGFIAQEVMNVFPSLVLHNVSKERNVDVYTLNYAGFGVIAIRAIQEQQQIIANLETRIAKLESALAQLTKD